MSSLDPVARKPPEKPRKWGIRKPTELNSSKREINMNWAVPDKNNYWEYMKSTNDISKTFKEVLEV